MNTIFIQVVDKPQRKALIKRGIHATHYFEYCEEVGCDVWNTLSNIKNALSEPAGMWLPKNLILPNTSSYVQGIEVPTDYTENIPDGYDLIDLPQCQMMVFQGPPFEEKQFEGAIESIWKAIETYNPETHGFSWAPELAPRMQLEPLCARGYIEMVPVKKI